MKITDTSKIETRVNCLVYGDSGVGKTTLCSTAPDPLIISIEGGLLSLKHLTIPVVEVKSRNDINDVFEWLTMSSESSKYQTICLDSLSECAEILLNEELKENKDPRQAYGAMASLMSTTIRSFLHLPKSTVFTAKNKSIIEEQSGVITNMPSVPGRVLLDSLPYFFDEVFKMDYVKIEGKQRRALITQGSRRFIAKDRSGMLDINEPPNLSKVFQKIKSLPTQ